MSRGIIRKARSLYTQSNTRGDLGRADRADKGELKLDETS